MDLDRMHVSFPQHSDGCRIYSGSSVYTEYVVCTSIALYTVTCAACTETPFS